jgi:CrcB protein
MRTYGAVAAGGVLGAAIRAFIVSQSPESPWVVAVINLVGCAVLAVILTRLVRAFSDSTWQPLARPFFASGVMGGFTTTSAFAVNVVELSHHNAVEAIAYVVISVFGGYALFDVIAKSAHSSDELRAP